MHVVVPPAPGEQCLKSGSPNGLDDRGGEKKPMSGQFSTLDDYRDPAAWDPGYYSMPQSSPDGEAGSASNNGHDLGEPPAKKQKSNNHEAQLSGVSDTETLLFPNFSYSPFSPPICIIVNC